MQPIYKYEVFGEILASTFPFPELEEAAEGAVPTWTVSRGDHLPVVNALDLLGEDSTSTGSRMRLFAGAGCYRLDAGSLGLFEIELEHSRITWYSGRHECMDCARQCILGRVFALAFVSAGGFCLHSAAVTIDGVGVALLQPSGEGKRLLLKELISAGGSLVADELVRLCTPDDVTRVLPGVRRLRTRPDPIAERSLEQTQNHPGGSRKYATLPRSVASDKTGCRLSAIYLLDVHDNGHGSGTRREKVRSDLATLEIMANSMVGTLLGNRTAHLRSSAVRLADSVDFFRLLVPRESGFVDVSKQLVEWHRPLRYRQRSK